MPYHEYRRMKAAHKFWHLQYSDVIRDVLRKLIPVLESPSGEVREILERHREAEIEKKRLREEARRKRTHGSDAEAALAAETVL